MWLGNRWRILDYYTPGKTKTAAKVPLPQKAIEIIEKYRHHPGCIAEGSLLPGMSNKKLNGYLKEIADLCGIQNNLTFHLASVKIPYTSKPD